MPVLMGMLGLGAMRSYEKPRASGKSKWLDDQGLLTNYKVAPPASTVVGRPATPVKKKKGKAPKQTYTTQTAGMLSPVAVAPAAPAGNITGRPVATPSKPAPTPPKQTAPVGIPSSDPVKTQPGETGPFDPNAEAPFPGPEEYSEVELSSPSAPTEESIEPQLKKQNLPQYYITDPNYGGSRGSEHGYEGGGKTWQETF